LKNARPKTIPVSTLRFATLISQDPLDVSLKQDPLRLLQGLSRNKTVVVAWNGSIDRGEIVYGAPQHPEYRQYPLHDFLVATPDAAV